MNVSLKDIEHYIFSPDKLSKGKRAYLMKLEEANEYFAALIELERTISDNLKKCPGELKSGALPLKLVVKPYVYQAALLGKKLILAAADYQTKTRFQTLASYISKEYGFIIRLSVDTEKSQMRISTLSNNMDFANLAFACLSFTGIDGYFVLDKHGKMNTPAGPEILKSDWSQKNMELLVPAAIFNNPDNDLEHEHISATIEEGDECFSFKCIKKAIYFPDPKKICTIRKNGSFHVQNLFNNTAIVDCERKDVERIIIYS